MGLNKFREALLFERKGTTNLWLFNYNESILIIKNEEIITNKENYILNVPLSLEFNRKVFIWD